MEDCKNTDRKVRVVLYARVSTKDKGQDPENQLRILRDLASHRRYDVLGEYVDHASGKDANRPAWKTVMDMANRRMIDGIFALRVDRIMRSVPQLCAVIDQLTADNVTLIFSDMTFNPRDPMSNLTINFLSAIAEWERQIISERTKEGLANRKEKGVRLGKKRRDDIPLMTLARMRMSGMSWYKMSQETGIPRTTIVDRRKEIERVMSELTDNVSSSVTMTEEGGVE
jgi:DNA invertase Pin-like site-specific DNA recombinase